MRENCDYGPFISDFKIESFRFFIQGFFCKGAGLTGNWGFVAVTWFDALGKGQEAVAALDRFLQETADKEEKSIIHLADPDNARSKKLFANLSKEGFYRTMHLGDKQYYIREFFPANISLNISL